MKLYGEISASAHYCKIVLLNDTHEVHEKWHLLHPDEEAVLSLLAPYSEVIQGLAIASFSFRKELIQRLMKSGYRVYLVNHKPDPEVQIEGNLAHQLYINISRRPDVSNSLLPWKRSTRKALDSQLMSRSAVH